MTPSKSFGRDTGLQTRMLITMFLLGLVYAVLVGALVVAGTGAETIALVAGIMFLVQLFASDKIALASMGARVISREQAPELFGVVERLCLTANVPMPRSPSRRRRCPTPSPSGARRRAQRSA
jgi:heat shock protein HtpX